MCVRWGSSVSSKFTVSNGVRQGGIMRQCSQLYAQARRFHNVLGQCESNYFSLLLFFVVYIATVVEIQG